jgi:hypothetical protein
MWNDSYFICGGAVGHEFVGILVTVEIVFQYAWNLPK